MNDFKKEYLYQQAEIDTAVQAVLSSGWYILGEQVASFEKEFATYMGSRYCIGVANGLEALQISLMACGIGPGDDVITVSNSAVATALAITNCGAQAIFVDVDEYYHMDPSLLEKAITSRTKAIIPVHLFGQMVDIHSIMDVAKQHNLLVIEDTCQAHGATYLHQKAGTFGITGCFSFYPTKNLGAYGDGGAIITDDEKVYALCQMLRNYGQATRYEHKVKGINSRLDELQAAILRVKLRHLNELTDRRRAIARIYSEQLRSCQGIKLPLLRKDSEHVCHLFVIQAEQRDDLLAHLKKADIQAFVHYPIPIHKQACYPEYNAQSLPRTEYYAEHIISLPIHPFITESEVYQVCQAIRKFYEE